MATSLENQYIDESYQKLVQIEGDVISDGTGSVITNLQTTVSNAITASHVQWTGIQNKPSDLVSGSQQITNLGFVKSGITGSLVETA